MLSPSDTAYPLLKANPSARELDEIFTPNLFELRFAEERTREATSAVGLLVLLKTFQRLGYFVKIADVPNPILRCISKGAGYQDIPDLTGYDNRTVRSQQMELVRSWLGVTAHDRTARHAMVKACVDASRVREDLADIINFAIEELVRQRYELPAFGALLGAAKKSRATVNLGYYSRVTRALDSTTKQRIDELFQRLPDGRRTGWDLIKSEPRQPTVKEIKRFVAHMNWLRGQAGDSDPLEGIPAVKVNRFAAEGRALNAARMRELTENKRHAVAAALLFRQRTTAFDDGAQMLIRQMGKIEHSADVALQAAQAQSADGATELVKTLRDVTLAYRAEGTGEDRLLAIGSSLGPDTDALLQRCDEHVALNTGNFVQLMPEFFRYPRKALLLLLENLPLESTSQDTRLQKAAAFVVENKSSRAQALPILREEVGADGASRQVPLLDLSFVPNDWWQLVTGHKKRSAAVTHVDRHYFEMCVLHQVSEELQSCDLCVPLGEKFRDYRRQLIPLEDYQQEVVTYSEQMNIPIDGKALVARLQSELRETARATDKGIPTNRHIRIEKGEPILSPVRAHPTPDGFARFEELLKERLQKVEIVDALIDTERWLHWTRFFGPISGLDAKIKRAWERYVLVVFCYGCNLGPVQTARSVRGTDRFKLAFINQRHITEKNLNDAITEVINAYVQVPLQRLWGKGDSASADGMKWDLYPQNLMSEYHIRYGGYGGIGYYMVSDSYIALMSRFTTCGSWEGHYILDFLKENESNVRPNTIHADTQGQSTAIFGLSYLPGIQLMPRIRNWKDQTFFRSGPDEKYEHIDDLFKGTVDWELIETMLPDMLRVAVSIKTGALLPSDILRRMSSHSRKNRLYFAFRELGRVVRTLFLLRYISDLDLRHVIQTATTKSERFNKFVQWVFFGGDCVIAENVRDEQRKIIKYNHLVANLLVFHNLVNMTRAIQKLEAEGYPVSEALLAASSPYPNEHINRLGTYNPNFGRVPEPLMLALELRKPPQRETAQVLVMPGSQSA
jgi:TnpA family transposase